MIHPLAAFQRATLWHLLQNYAEAVVPKETTVFVENDAVAADTQIAERLMNVFHNMLAYEETYVSPEKRPNAGVWEMVKHEFHGELYRITASRNVPVLAEYLRNFLRSGAAYGLGAGDQVFDAMRGGGDGLVANLAIITDRLASLAVAIGALPQENPEQGRYGVSLNLTVARLTTLIEGTLKTHIYRPPVAGLFGVEVASGQIIDTRVPDDAYSAFRLKTLMDIFGLRRVCEIGAGFGGTAFQAARHGMTPYTIIDLPSVNVLQGYFLMRIFGADAVKMFGEDVPDRRFNILPYWMFFDRKVSFDLVFNRDSMPEMPEERAREYLEEMQQRRCAFLSINQEAEALGGEATQLVVHQLAKSYPGLRSAGRHPAWTRKGYVEEFFMPTVLTAPFGVGGLSG